MMGAASPGPGRPGSTTPGGGSGPSIGGSAPSRSTSPGGIFQLAVVPAAAAAAAATVVLAFIVTVATISGQIDRQHDCI